MTYQDHFIKCWPNEGTGYLKNGEFFPLENIADDKRHTFKVDPKFLLNKPDVLLHSHTVGVDVENPKNDPHSPSFPDLEGQISTGVEWGICVVGRDICEEPLFWGNPEHRPPLVGRKFIFNIQDCLSLAQDWFYDDRKVILPNQPRNPHWNDEGENLIEDLYEKWGFERIPVSEIERGNVLFYRVRSPVVNHIGIYLGNNEVISHWYGQISCVEDLSRWASHIEFAARLKP